jgi:uncharacterized protein YwqG
MSSELEIELSNQLFAFKETIEATIKPFIEIKAKADSNLRFWQSKFGGFPYLPKNYQYPKDASGHYLSLLAQINFAETPKLEKFPERGILQFYISGGDDSDHVYGSSFDELTKQDYFRVLYFEDIVENEDHLMTNFAFLPKADLLPFETSCSLTFAMRYAPLPVVDYQFEALILKQNILKPGDNIYAAFEEYEKRYTSAGHKIGGYPYFTQNDPRHDEKYKADGFILLFQMDTDDEAKIMWGDCGVGNFFIQEKDMERKDFSKTLYSWDCC